MPLIVLGSLVQLMVGRQGRAFAAEMDKRYVRIMVQSQLLFPATCRQIRLTFRTIDGDFPNIRANPGTNSNP